MSSKKHRNQPKKQPTDSGSQKQKQTPDQQQISSLDEAKNLFGQLLEMELGPEEMVAGFLDAWLHGDYEAAYTALAKDSPLREGLTATEWAARRSLWAKQVHPTQGRSEIAYRQDDDDDDLDDEDDEGIVVPSTIEEAATDTPPEVEAFWSFSLTNTETDIQLKELPQATTVYKATGRQWFWAKYTLVREGEKWLIFDMVDAGAEALLLPIDVLQERLAEIIEFAEEQLELVEAIAESQNDDEDDDLEDEDDDLEDEDDDLEDEDDEDLEFEELAEHFEEMMWVTSRAMHYTDALISQTPEDASLYEMGYDQATAIQENERAAAYIEMQAERFPEFRGEALRKLAVAQLNIATSYEENDDEENANRFMAEAEKALRDSIVADDAAMGRILLAQTLIAQNKQLDEAEQLLKQVLAQPEVDTTISTLAEAGLGTVAQFKEDFEQALKHYLRASEMSSDLPGIWFNVGLMQRQLGQLAEAEESYLRSIEESPTETGAYIDLAGIYTDKNDIEAAEEILEEGLVINPDAADLLAGMALIYINKGDLRHAKEYLDEAEDIDPDEDIVQVVHQYYDEARQAQKQPQKSKGKSRKFKKK